MSTRRQRDQMRRIVLVIGRAGRGLLGDVRRSARGVWSAASMSDGPRSDAATRVLVWARIGKDCANASFTTETRRGVFDSGAEGDGVNAGTRSDRSHTDSGAENGKTTS